MSIIYSYPIKGTPANNDLILISDSSDSNKTKQIRVSTLPGGSASGVSSFNTLTGAVTITGGTGVTLNTVGQNIEIQAAGGTGTVTGTGTENNLALWSAGGTAIQDSIVQQNAAGNTLSINADNVIVNAAITHASDPDTFMGFSAENEFSVTAGSNKNLLVNSDKVVLYREGNAKAETGDGGFTLLGGGGSASNLRLSCSQNNHWVDINGPEHTGAVSYALTLPNTLPSVANQILESNASGTLSWIPTPSGGGGGVSSVTATTPIVSTGGTTPVISLADISPSPAGNYTNSNITVDAKGRITTASNGASGGVSSFTNANGTFVSAATVNTSATGAVTTGAIDLSATGTPTSENFLRGDNTWATPSSITYSAGTGLSLVGTTFSLATGAALTNLGGGAGGDYLRQDGSWATPTGTNIANANLTLNSNRILALSSYSLQFTGTNVFRLSNAETTDNISLLIGNNLKVDGQAWVDIQDGGESTGNIQIDWDNGNVQEFTLSGNVNWTCTNQQPGATYIMIVNQPAGQSYIQSFSQDFDWLNNNTAPGTTTAARADVYSFVCRSATSLLGTYSEDFI